MQLSLRKQQILEAISEDPDATHAQIVCYMVPELAEAIFEQIDELVAAGIIERRPK